MENNNVKNDVAPEQLAQHVENNVAEIPTLPGNLSQVVEDPMMNTLILGQQDKELSPEDMSRSKSFLDLRQQFKNNSSKIANVAQDLVINGMLTKGFDNVNHVPSFDQSISAADADKYHKLAEETIANMLLIRKQAQESSNTNTKTEQKKPD